MTGEQAAKKKIAILGGGVGAITTAYHLTNEPGWEQRYEVTIYQMGWRLGGKGACGRNAGKGNRIEEHGPHVWFGFYFTAFEMLERLYDHCREKGLLPPGCFQNAIPDAMRPKHHSTVMENVAGQWKPWHIDLPATAGSPEQGRPNLIDQLIAAIDWIGQLHDKAVRPHGIDSRAADPGEHTRARVLWAIYRAAVKLIGSESLKARIEARAATVLQVIRGLLEHIREHLNAKLTPRRRFLAWLGSTFAASFLDGFRKKLRQDLAPLVQANDDVRRIWIMIDLAVAALRGIFRDGILWNGFESINEEDFTRWLERHGCENPWSPVLQGIYDTCFAFQNGNTSGDADQFGRPASASMEAGTTLRGMLMMFFGYTGSFAYKMQSGMGDTIFTPAYLALKDRGVKFEFFHRVRNLGVNGNHIETIDMDLQATPNGPGGYKPLQSGTNYLAWPNQPFYEQLEEGEFLKANAIDLESAWSGWEGKSKRLERGTHFDIAVLGISLGAFRWICGELIDARKEWRDMVENVTTVQTQSFQWWMRKTAKEMGWAVDDIDEEKRQPGELHTGELELLSGYTQPIDSWADMSQVLAMEDWKDEDVRSVQYLFGPLEDAEEIPRPGVKSDFPQQQRQRVRDEMSRFAKNDVRPFWPRAISSTNPGGLNWDVLFDSTQGAGEARLDWQYWRANVEPSERYVLTVAGTTKFRLEPGKSGFDNLFLAGDWTRNGFNVGCVEAAALSGVQAAQAVGESLKDSAALAARAAGGR